MSGARDHVQKQLDKLLKIKLSPPKLDLKILADLKPYLRSGEELWVRLSHERIFKCLQSRDPLIRLNCVLFSDYLVQRSHHFRLLISDSLHQFMQLTVGLNGRALPSPPNEALQLKNSALLVLGQWNEKYGVRYRGFRLGYEYLVRSQEQGDIDPVSALEVQRQQEERENKARQLLKQQEIFNKYSGEADEVIKETTEVISQINGYFDILLPSSGESSSCSTSTRPKLVVAENAENRIVYDGIRENLKVMRSRLLPFIEKWIRIVAFLDPGDDAELKQQRDDRLEKALECRNHLATVDALCLDFGIIKEEEEEEMFEEVESIVPLLEDTESNEESRDTTVKDKEQTEPTEPQDCSDETPNTLLPDAEDESENQIRRKLLRAAPFIEYDDDLYYWDKDKVQFNTTGIEFHHRFLGDGKGDNYLSNETLENLRKRRIYYSDTKDSNVKKLKQCRYPMKKGKVCPRLHAEECTFHGKIIPRDETGVPLNSQQEEELRADIAENAIRNQLFQDLMSPKRLKRKIVESSHDRIQKRISSTTARQRVIKEIQRQESQKMRDRGAFKW